MRVELKRTHTKPQPGQVWRNGDDLFLRTDNGEAAWVRLSDGLTFNENLTLHEFVGYLAVSHY